MENSGNNFTESNIELGFFKKFINSIFYSKKLVFVIGIIAVFVLVLYFAFTKIFSSSFNSWIDPIVTVMTFVVAIALGISDLYDKWINSIEKRLTVHIPVNTRPRIPVILGHLVKHSSFC